MDMAPAPRQKPAAPRLGRDALVGSICGLVVVLMVGAAYAAVPFCNWFCRTTGFNGTTQVAKSAPSAAPLERKVAIRFDSNVAGGLPWKFEPEQTEIEIKIGQAAAIAQAMRERLGCRKRRRSLVAHASAPKRRQRGSWPSRRPSRASRIPERKLERQAMAFGVSLRSEPSKRLNSRSRSPCAGSALP